ncbi:hypothetical protein ALC53_12813 [Atta colombica]|uniref:Uncharacterized protein n=1 Tax=Atta colombica TaxID=520822 RepID=A0A151HYS3_9HYME|nr:hypothetical protein ALC53_12813 [Atta colombica]
MFTLNGNYKWSAIKIASPATFKHELHRATHPDVYLVEKVLRRKIIFTNHLRNRLCHNAIPTLKITNIGNDENIQVSTSFHRYLQ